MAGKLYAVSLPVHWNAAGAHSFLICIPHMHSSYAFLICITQRLIRLGAAMHSWEAIA